MIQSEKPSVYIKRSKMQDLFDYCLDNKIEFTVKERNLGIDEFEITMDVTNVKRAVLLGMFLRENRMELAGMPQIETKVAAKKATPTKKPSESIASASNGFLESNSIDNSIPKPEIQNETPSQNTLENDNSLPLSFDLN